MSCAVRPSGVRKPVVRRGDGVLKGNVSGGTTDSRVGVRAPDTWLRPAGRRWTVVDVLRLLLCVGVVAALMIAWTE